MRGMKRPLSLAAASFAALTLLALPASAESARVVRGAISSITTDTLAVKGPSGIVTTCSLGKHSPSVAGYSAGDRVQAVCLRVHAHGQLVLAKLRHLPALPAAAANDDAVTKFGGAITALGDGSITLHDGDRDLTCSLGTTSPATGDYKVGQHAVVACAGGTLVAISPVTTGDLGRYFIGSVAEIGTSSLTLTTDHGPVTCTFGDGTPSVAALHVGDHIGMGCKASTMQLVLIRKLDGDGGTTTTTTAGTTETTTTPAPSAPTPVLTGARGVLSAFTDGSLTVHTDGGDVTCTLGSSSPGLTGFAVGDLVKMACWDGVLHEIAKVS
jgi:hypothetical protein